MQTFAQRLQFGRSAEERVAHLLQHRYGCYVVPAYNYSAGDKSPKLQGAAANYVVPDLDVSKDGRRNWVEVKAKANAGSPTRITGQVDYGFSGGCSSSTAPSAGHRAVFIIILEVLTGDILYQSLDALDEVKRVYDGDKMDRGGTVFFPRASFAYLCNIQEAAQ
jgi:hypothetical protein